MAILKLEHAEVFEPLPVDSIVQVECTGIQEREQTGGRSGSWTKLEFTFDIIGVPSSLQPQYSNLIGTKIWGSAPARFSSHPDNKLRQWTEALLGLNLADQIGFELDTDHLIGRKARAVISQYTKNNGRQQHQVEGLLPASGSMAAPQSAPSSPVATTGSAQVSDPWSTAQRVMEDEPPF